MLTRQDEQSFTPLQRITLLGDDVVFMYTAVDVKTYSDYGCTFLAWGGASTGAAVRQMQSLGIHSTGSLWCLTAGAQKLHNDADLREAVCRDINKNPIPVWWLFDNTFEGTPTWFGCTNHPAFRAHVRQRVAEEMRGGAVGLHVDDHLGTAHSVAFLGGCFCDYCMDGFNIWLQKHATSAIMNVAGATSWESFDYRTFVKTYAADDAAYQKNKESIPLYNEFLDFQLQQAAENVRQLGAIAAEIVQKPITLSANTTLPELPHLVVTPYLTHLIGEVAHHAEKGTAQLLDAVHAYRMAEAIGKPIAACAKGQDYAWVKAIGSTNLVKIWIALGYCAGQRLMAPHRQWCFTLELGSHWYEGPTEAYAPLYCFVRSHPELFRQTKTVGPLAAPENVPKDLDTVDGRITLQRALSQGDPQPLSCGGVWIFPRRGSNGSLIVHMLNLNYDPVSDVITPLDRFRVSIDKYGMGDTGAGLLHSFDAEPISLPVKSATNHVSFTLPQLRIWAVLVIQNQSDPAVG